MIELDTKGPKNGHWSHCNLKRLPEADLKPISKLEAKHVFWYTFYYIDLKVSISRAK